MTRLTIALSDEKHLALKQAALRRNMTIGQLIEASLDFYGIKSVADAASIVAKARDLAKLASTEAQELAVAETRKYRRT